jgi:hypothetical protein
MTTFPGVPYVSPDVRHVWIVPKTPKPATCKVIDNLSSNV